MSEITMKMVDGYKTIFMGEENDVTLYANANLEHLSKTDIITQKPVFKIKCDSGVYPGIINFEDYMCAKAYRWLIDEE